MSTPANVNHTAAITPFSPGPELDAQLAGEYAAHLAIWDQRLEEALTFAGFDGAIVFAGEPKRIFRDDQNYPFRVEPYFNAWVPLTEAPGSFLRLVPGQRPMLVYLQADDYWHEPPASPAGFWTSHFDIRVVRSKIEARRLAGGSPRWVAIGSAARSAAKRGTSDTHPAVNDPRVLNHLDYARGQKTGFEIVCMRAAQARAVEGHLAVERAFRSGVSEFELHQAFLSGSWQRETELPYGNIIGLNEHAAVLHYQRLRTQPPSANRSLLIDAGAAYHGYAADITRTYSASPGDDFAALITSVEAMQQRLCREVRPGIDFVSLHAAAQTEIATLLREHGVVKCSPEEALAAGITRTFMPHGLGHLLGLQVHDAGGRLADTLGTQRSPPAQAPFLRLTRALKIGFVLTIEPGIYFIPQLVKALFAKHGDKVNRGFIERLAPFGGIRIEDNVEVTADGHRNLTREAFAAACAHKPRK